MNSGACQEHLGTVVILPAITGMVLLESAILKFYFF